MTTRDDHEYPGEKSIPPELDDLAPLEFDEEQWEAFLPDDDTRDPIPEPGDFWIEFDFRKSEARAA